MTRSVRALLGALLALVACDDATAPLPTDGPPRELTYSTGGFVLVSNNVRLVGDTVVYTVARERADSVPAVVTMRRKPTANEWRAFWRTVRDAGVARWPARCADAGATDGGIVEFALAWGGTRRTGTYYAAYPTGRGACVNGYDDEGDAARFRDAVVALAGADSSYVFSTR